MKLKLYINPPLNVPFTSGKKRHLYLHFPIFQQHPTMAANNLYSCDNLEIYQSISDENTKEDDEKEAGTQTGPSLSNCKDRGQAISNASRGFGNQVCNHISLRK